MMPALDQAVSERLGHDIESLARIPDYQPRPEPRWALTTAAFEHLWAVRGRGLVNSTQRNSDAGHELRTAGLTTRFGAPTDAGLMVTAALERPTATFGIEARHGGRTAAWGYWATPSGGVIRSRSSVAELLEELDDDRVRLDLAPLSIAIGRALNWIGMTPAWAIADNEPLLVADDVLDRRIDTAGVPSTIAPSADWVMQRLWAQPRWASVRGWSTQTHRGFSVIMAGDAGMFRRKPAGPGTSALEPIPSSTLLQDVLVMFTGETTA